MQIPLVGVGLLLAGISAARTECRYSNFKNIRGSHSEPNDKRTAGLRSRTSSSRKMSHSTDRHTNRTACMS